MKALRFIFLVAIPVVLLSCNNNPNRNKDKTDNTSEGDMSLRSNDPGKDDEFVKEASSGSMMEVELGRYAEENALNQRVKNFGAMMVRDHTKANAELKSLAASKNLDLQSSMDDTHLEMVSDLQKKKGADFDKEYMKSMVDDHQEDIDKFKKQAEDGSDPELKAFAAKTVPVLQAHLDSAKNIQKTLK